VTAIKRTKFSQSDLIEKYRYSKNYEFAKNGVCSAASVYWLSRVMESPNNSAQVRLKRLKTDFEQIMELQMLYAVYELRVNPIMKVRVDARGLMADQLGLHLQKAIKEERKDHPSMDYVYQALKEDISSFGDAAYWSFSTKDGDDVTNHAIAAICNIHSTAGLGRAKNRHTKVLQIFDSNQGEFECGVEDLDRILKELFKPTYVRKIIEVNRMKTSFKVM